MENNKFEVEKGALRKVPFFDRRSNANNWMAVLVPNSSAKDGVDRKWQQRAKGDGYFYYVRDISIADAVEFGSDFYVAGKRKNRKRWYGVVVSICSEFVEFEVCPNLKNALSTAKKMKDVPTKKKNLKHGIFNLSFFFASKEMKSAGVVEPADKNEVRNLLTFSEKPSGAEIAQKTSLLTKTAEEGGLSHALISGPSYLISSLEKSLRGKGIVPVYSFGHRKEVEGRKKYRHEAFIAVKSEDEADLVRFQISDTVVK